MRDLAVGEVGVKGEVGVREKSVSVSVMPCIIQGDENSGLLSWNARMV
jgi:hypothetical protein